MMKWVWFLAILLLLTGCAALGGAAVLDEVLGKARDFTNAKIAEVTSRGNLYASLSALAGTAGAVALRWADHKVKGKK